MATFASLLGSAAEGFNQAHQIDMQRQFENEQNMRQQALQHLFSIANNPDALPEARNAAIRAGLQVTQTPQGKFNQATFGKIFAGIIQPATPPTTQSTVTGGGPVTTGQGQRIELPQPPVPPGGMFTQGVPTNLQQAAQGPPPSPLDPNGFTAPSRTLQALPQEVQHVTPGQPGGIFMTPEQIGQHQASIIGQSTMAQTMGQMRGTLEALRQTIPGFEQLDPTTQAALARGSVYSALQRTVGTGSGYAGELRKQGYTDIPPEIKDDQFVSIRELAGGRRTYEPMKAPGEVAGGEGKLISPMEAERQRNQIKQEFWSQRNRVQFAQQLALQQTGLQNALVKSDYTTAKKLVEQSRENYDDSLDRMATMDENLTRAKAGDQQAMVSLVANHIGMTLGMQKGARITRAVWEEAMQSAPILQRMAARFDDRGYLSGVTLSPEQMDAMVDLAHEKVDILHNHVGRVQTTYKEELSARKGGANKLPAVPTPEGGGKNAAAKQAPAGATHIGIGSVDKKKHYLDASGKDLGLAE